MLPQSLSTGLSRYQQSSKQRIRLLPVGATTFAPGSEVVFKLPTSGVIDLHSLAMAFTMQVGATGSTTGSVTVGTPEFLSQLIERMDVNIGGHLIGLNGVANYGDVYYLSRKYGLDADRSVFMDAFLEGKADFKIVDANVNKTVTNEGIISDFAHGLIAGSHVRYLPLSLLPEVSVTFRLAPKAKWFNSATNASYISGGSAIIDDALLMLKNVRMMFNRIDFEDGMLEKMYAERLVSAPIQIGFTNYVWNQGEAFTSNTDFNTQISSQDIEQLFITLRPSDYTTNQANRYRFTCGDSAYGSSFQLLINGSPCNSWALNPVDALVASQEAMGAVGSSDYAPYLAFNGNSASFSDWATNVFSYIHSFTLGLSAEERRHLLTGISTYGSNVPLSVSITGVTDTVRPVVMAKLTSILEVSAGKQVTFIA